MRNWKIVMFFKPETELAPFTPEQLLAGRAEKGWHYREVWPDTKYQIEEIKRQEIGVNFGHKYPEIGDMRQRWCKETGVSQDNHQTFLVRIDGRLYFVMFHDGHINIGERGRMEH